MLMPIRCSEEFGISDCPDFSRHLIMSKITPLWLERMLRSCYGIRRAGD